MNTVWSTDPAPTLIADRVLQFRDPRDAAQPLPPSFAFLQQPKTTGQVPSTPRTAPRFTSETVAGVRHRTVHIPVTAGTTLYGCGEAAGPLARDGRKIQVTTTDSFDYTDVTPALYQAHPWVLAVRPDGTAFGVLADTTCRLEIDLTSTDWMSNSAGQEPGIVFRARDGLTPPFAVYVIERDHPGEVVRALAELTGKMPMPPRWALGYHQCRWSYEPDARVRKLADDFRTHRIPCDVIWLDIDYMNGFRCFTFDETKFPSPKALNDELHSKGFKTVWMIDPGLKLDPEYSVYASGLKNDVYVKDVYGNDFHGSVWPGPCAFPDFTRAATRKWWAGLYKDYLATGIDGVWNDMNEPAVFDVPDKQMAPDAWHRADAELGGPAPHFRYRNVYGMLMVAASREGIAAARPDKRPFVLTRSNFIGGQRYAATWTGDNRSDWHHLHWSITMALNMGLSGQPFVGPDIGGFVGEATPELFARWMGIGAMLPFSRAHSIKDSADHEPWAFGEACTNTCRRALERRYRLLPYLYTLFHQSHTDGLPIVRPLFFTDPRDPALRHAEDAFLLGRDLLVRCSTTPDGVKRAPLPRGTWRVWDPTPMETGPSDPNLPELRFRAGSIVPMGPAMQYESERPLDPVTIIITPDEHGHAEGMLYEDAGDGYTHEKGQFRLTRFQCHRHGGELIIKAERAGGSMPDPTWGIDAVILLDGKVITAKGRDGEPIRVPIG